nr:pre-rrna-processing protein esf2 [Quercus suber]
MTTRKLNEFLDFADETESGEDGHGALDVDDAGYDSEAVELQAKARATKRRKLAGVEDNGSERGDESEAEEEKRDGEDSDYHTADETAAALELQAPRRIVSANSDGSDAEHVDDEGDDNDEEDDDNDGGAAAAQRKALRKAALARSRARKSGVLYISRVPPFMKPTTLRQLLTPYAGTGGLGRIFLTPEDGEAHLRRVRRGGNKKKSYTDGWVEFGSKKEAKRAAERLNGGIIGGKKGGFYHDDLWNVKYLRGFKWGDLTEQINNENAERAARVREEVRRTKRENGAFVRDIERGKMVAGMERKRAGADVEKRKGKDFDFKQTKVRRREDTEGGGLVAGTAKQTADVTRVLRKIF